MVRSPFFGLALLFTLLNYSQWITPEWPKRAEALIPNLLGFSLGTYAILFSIMSSRLKNALRSVCVSADSNISWLESINATFFHFIFIQVMTLIWSFLYQGSWLFDLARALGNANKFDNITYKALSLAGSFTGMFLLTYSILLMVASALAIYRLAMIRERPDPSNKK